MPRERADDLIYFDPSDTARPMGLNILEFHDDADKELVVMDAMNIMIKLFDAITCFMPYLQWQFS